MEQKFKILKFNISHITFIGKNPETFDKPNANWFNVRALYKVMDQGIPNYKRAYLKTHLEFLRISEDGKSFEYSNKADGFVMIYDVESKKSFRVLMSDVEIDNITREPFDKLKK